MFSIFEILGLLLLHWIADFVYQDESWANGKSKKWIPLIKHTVMYSVVMWSFLLLSLLIKYGGEFSTEYHKTFGFLLITFVTHTVTDYFTSRVVSQKFEAKEYGSKIPNFGAFTIIGFDQWLHYVQLFITYQYLFK